MQYFEGTLVLGYDKFQKVQQSAEPGKVPEHQNDIKLCERQPLQYDSQQCSLLQSGILSRLWKLS